MINKYPAINTYPRVVKKALDVASMAHGSQLRKGGPSPIPYIEHPIAVAKIVQDYDEPKELVAAALLHDVLVIGRRYDRRQMANDFGIYITQLVLPLARTKFYDSRKQDQLRALKELRAAPHLGSFIIAAADNIVGVDELIGTDQAKKNLPEDQIEENVKNIDWYIESTKIIEKAIPKHEITSVIGSRL